jgi:hypothetical protein
MNAAAKDPGVPALKRLYTVAQGHSGQCRHIARFLLGLYNGNRFPFDLTDLRCIDSDLFDDCMVVLTMDARRCRQEVHTYFVNGGAMWEQMAHNWRVADVFAIRCAAKRLAEQVGFSGPHAATAAELIDLIDGKKPRDDAEGDPL